jgi:hypothetical protein
MKKKVPDKMTEGKASGPTIHDPKQAKPAKSGRGIDAKTLAAWLGTSVRTFQRRRAEGAIPDPIKATGQPRWRAAEIRLWMFVGQPTKAEWVAMAGPGGKELSHQIANLIEKPVNLVAMVAKGEEVTTFLEFVVHPGEKFDVQSELKPHIEAFCAGQSGSGSARLIGILPPGMTAEECCKYMIARGATLKASSELMDRATEAS